MPKENEKMSAKVKSYLQLQKGWSTCFNSNRDADAARHEDQMEELWKTMTNEDQRHVININNKNNR